MMWSFGFLLLIKLQILFIGSIEKNCKSFFFAMLAQDSNNCITCAPAFIWPIACFAIAFSNKLKSLAILFLFF